MFILQSHARKEKSYDLLKASVRQKESEVIKMLPVIVNVHVNVHVFTPSTQR